MSLSGRNTWACHAVASDWQLSQEEGGRFEEKKVFFYKTRATFNAGQGFWWNMQILQTPSALTVTTRLSLNSAIKAKHWVEINHKVFSDCVCRTMEAVYKRWELSISETIKDKLHLQNILFFDSPQSPWTHKSKKSYGKLPPAAMDSEEIWTVAARDWQRVYTDTLHHLGLLLQGSRVFDTFSSSIFIFNFTFQRILSLLVHHFANSVFLDGRRPGGNRNIF